MKAIHGTVKNFQYVDGIVGQLPKIQSEVAGTALVSIFSESGKVSAVATSGGGNKSSWLLHSLSNKWQKFLRCIYRYFFAEDDKL